MGSFWEGLFYIFRQKYWFLELLLSILLASIPILGYFLIKGWEFEISVRVRHGAPRLLPGWRNPFQKLFRGMIIRFAAFLYNLPTFTLLGITIYLWIEPLIAGMQSPEASRQPLSDVYSQGLGLRISMVVITIIVAFVCNSLYWSGYLRYIDSRRYSLFFDVVTNFRKTSTTFVDDLLLSIYLMLASLIATGLDAGAGSLLTLSGVGTVIAPIVLPAITFTFMSVVKGYWFGAMARNAYKTEK